MSLSTDREAQGAGSAPAQGPVLGSEQLKAKLSLYVGTLPSTVLEDLFQTLKSMALPEPKVDEIIERTIKTYSGQESNTRMDELVDKMNNLEDTLIRALKSIETRRERAPEIEERGQAETEPAQPLETFSPEFASDPQNPPARKRARQEPDYAEEEDSPGLESEPLMPGNRHRILLPDVPENAISNAILLKWVEFLLETVGHQNLPEVLDYYVDIGWISEKVTMKLLAYASGMVAPRGRAREKLSTKDHLRSLLFIEKLRGKDFDQSKLTRLEREIEYTIEKRIRHD